MAVLVDNRYEIQTWTLVEEISLFDIQYTQMRVSERLDGRLLCHYSGLTVPRESFFAVVHDGQVIILHTQAVYLSSTVLIKRKPEL